MRREFGTTEPPSSEVELGRALLALTRHGKAEFLKRLGYLENVRQCRLGVFCRHFGGSPPARCRGLCDICCGEGPAVLGVLRLDEWACRFCSSWTGVLAEYKRLRPGATASLRKVIGFMCEERRAEWLAHSLSEGGGQGDLHHPQLLADSWRIGCRGYRKGGSSCRGP